MKSKIIQNSESSSMLSACKTAASKALVKSISIATAFISLPGLIAISRFIDSLGIKNVRVLIGARPSRDFSDWRQPSEAHLKEQTERQRSDLTEEFSKTPFAKKPRTDMQELSKKSEDGRVQVRIYTDNFMHAKAYIFSDESRKQGEIIVGSSNLTRAGLQNNIEMSMGNQDDPSFEEAAKWFDELWEKSEEFDISQAVRIATDLKTPYEIFLRVLWEEYKNDLGNQADYEVLTSFQQHGVARALRILDRRRGVILADEVGLGKTYMAGQIIKEYHKKGQRALIICPAALREAVWKRHLKTQALPYTDILSYEQFGRDVKLLNLSGEQKVNDLDQEMDKYQLIVIDEAHNYRNLKAPQRGGALTSFLRGRRRDVLMLTATPVNNSLWDLYNLIMYFLRQDTAFSDKRIPSIQAKFMAALEGGGYSHIPNLLFQIIDAITVKRTRKFIKEFYPGDTIPTESGKSKLVFPTPVPITIKYDLDKEMPAVYNIVERYLDVNNPNRLSMAIYKTDCYQLDTINDETRGSIDALAGLVISGLLKRFESSKAAFRKSLRRKIAQHEKFLAVLDQGHVIGKTYFDSSLQFSDEDEDYWFDEKNLDVSKFPAAAQYNSEELGKDVGSDLGKLKEILETVERLDATDIKYLRVVKELESIAKEASKAKDTQSQRDRSKVIIFSFYADTAEEIHRNLKATIKENSNLSCYLDEDGRPRINLITGEHKRSRADMAKRFAPRYNGGNNGQDKIDILVSTDVMAEGVNLQQARNLINYDLPWNPMRLVQRHGRLDRIDSPHDKIYLRSIFPDDRLDDLLGLKDKIDQKISWAASSVGIVSPVKISASHDRVFTDTKEEIHKLRDENPSIYENAEMQNTLQSGEAYRQILRKELNKDKERISKLPLQSGSIMRKGKDQGVYFLAKIRNQFFHCFIYTKRNWRPIMLSGPSGKQDKYDAKIDLGSCLRIIECSREDELVDDKKAGDAALELWADAKEIIQSEWKRYTNPKNLQPEIKGVNRKVAEFLQEKGFSPNVDGNDFDRAIDILNTPWPKKYRDEMAAKFNSEQDDSTKLEQLVDYINNCGLDPAEYPEPFDEISYEDIQLIVWMAVLPEKK